MNVNEYLKRKKEMYNILINFIAYESDSQDEDYQTLIKYFESQKIQENREEFKELLHLILKIANNHHRQPNFFNKIEIIILYFEDSIKQSFSNSEIFDIFKSNKRITFFLYEKKILIIDETIFCFSKEKYSNSIETKFIETKFFHYFYPELKSSFNEEILQEIEKEINPEILENFDEKRRIGENESKICEIIRKDSLEMFTTYVNQTNFQLFNRISPSIFETNRFLLKNNPNLIEYAAFNGSFQIFQYLYSNGVELTPSLWFYAIHGQNFEIINFLVENKIEPEDKKFEKCVNESIKCHHNEITRYIQNNLINEKNDEDNDKLKFDNDILSFSFRYYNFEHFPTDYNQDKNMFFYACQYDYLSLVKLLLKSEDIKINEKIISNNTIS